MTACGSRSRPAGRAGAAALHKISVVSFGEQKPVPNTANGRSSPFRSHRVSQFN
jgi:hypothetical protein